MPEVCSLMSNGVKFEFQTVCPPGWFTLSFVTSSTKTGSDNDRCQLTPYQTDVSWPNHYIIVHRVQLAMLYIQLCIAFYNNIVYCKFVMISNKFFNRSMLYRLNCVVWMGIQHSHTDNLSGLGEMALTSKHCIHQRLIVKSSETLGQGRHRRGWGIRRRSNWTVCPVMANRGARVRGWQSNGFKLSTKILEKSTFLEGNRKHSLELPHHIPSSNPVHNQC